MTKCHGISENKTLTMASLRWSSKTSNRAQVSRKIRKFPLFLLKITRYSRVFTAQISGSKTKTLQLSTKKNKVRQTLGVAS